VARELQYLGIWDGRRIFQMGDILQSLNELEKWWVHPDPWKYEDNNDDLTRRTMLLSVLPRKRYKKALDIGCGNGFVTTRLPCDEILGIDISANAIEHAKKRSEGQNIRYLQASVFDLPELLIGQTFDLVIISGLLYPQYIGKSELLIYIIIDNLLQSDGHLVSCHIEEWYNVRFPYIQLVREYYPYREYNHILEVYLKQ